MAKLNIKLTSPGVIDNAVIYLEDPTESIPNHFQPKTDSEWELKNVSVPVLGNLEYSLHVLAYNGTSFECVINRDADSKTIKLKGKTGSSMTHRANIKGSKKFT